MSTTLPAAKHSDVSHQYGCPATLTVAYFMLHGLAHQACRFWREDLGVSARIEIYTIEPYPGAANVNCTELGWHSSAALDFLDHVDETRLARIDTAAMIAIAGAQGSTYDLDGALVRTTLLEMA